MCTVRCSSHLLGGRGGCLPRGVSARGCDVSQHTLRQTPPTPVDRILAHILLKILPCHNFVCIFKSETAKIKDKCKRRHYIWMYCKYEQLACSCCAVTTGCCCCCWLFTGTVVWTLCTEAAATAGCCVDVATAAAAAGCTWWTCCTCWTCCTAAWLTGTVSWMLPVWTCEGKILHSLHCEVTSFKRTNFQTIVACIIATYLPTAVCMSVCVQCVCVHMCVCVWFVYI